MAGNILLVSANRYTKPYPVYPLGLCHVAAALRHTGHRVSIIDMNRDYDSLVTQIKTSNPDIIGLSIRNIDDADITCAEFFVPEIISTIETIKHATNAPVILGGSAYSLFPGRLLALSGADYGIWGEGEVAFCALVAALEQNRFPADIPGLVYRDNNEIIINKRNTAGLYHIPLPDHPEDLIDYYVKHSSILNVQTQRGCAHTCCYCTYPLIEGREIRFREPRQIAEEIEKSKRFGTDYFFIVDSVFNTSVDHVCAVCEEFIRRNLGIRWGCFLRPRGLTRQLMELMSRAGLCHIEFGSDSFCDPVLEAYGKGFTFTDIEYSSACAHACGIHYAHFLIAGGPEETEETLLEGFRNSQHLKRTVIFPYIGMRIYPETPLARRAQSEKVISPEDDLLTPVFYISPALKKERIVRLLEQFKETSRNWIFGEINEETVRIMKGLRSIGVKGPLWEYLAC